LEDIVVGLLAPQAPAEARVFKLVVRMLQSGRLELDRLLFRAKRERALGPLYWLVWQIPNEERTAAVGALLARLAVPPRGYRALRFRYDPQRLVRPSRSPMAWTEPPKMRTC
ncbi:MAG: hypothetical protein ACYC8T_23400, partial [Myxococcaceae bacterium]